MSESESKYREVPALAPTVLFSELARAAEPRSEDTNYRGSTAEGRVRGAGESARSPGHPDLRVA
jgi:hypothetical protein